MAKHQKKQEEEGGGESAPLWIISFADMISLLMAFFVMLSTFSTFGEKEAADLRNVAKAALAPYGGWLGSPPKTGLSPQVRTSGQTPEGAQKPTLEQTLSTDSINETGPKDFRREKVFTINSSEIFYMGGGTLSQNGKDFLDTMAKYLAKVPARIVICENKPTKADERGTVRSVIVAEYLIRRGVPKQNCNVAGALMYPAYKDKGRVLEITFLEESVCK